jgi:hypothetical protein
MHAAKGREWDSVFAVGCHDGGIPLLNSSSTGCHGGGGLSSARAAALEAELAEERRLFYVCLTRARAEVTVTYAALRDGGGGGRNAPSRFLSELPSACVMWTQSLGNAAAGGAGGGGAAGGAGWHGGGDAAAFYGGGGGGGGMMPPPPPQQMQMAPPPPRSDAEVMAAAAASAFMPPPGGGAASGLALPPSFPPPSDFLQRFFRAEQRSSVASLFHHFAKSAAFRADPARLVAKVGFSLAAGGGPAGGGGGTTTSAAHRDAMATLKNVLGSEECLAFAAHVAALEALPADERALAAAARAAEWARAGGARKMSEAPASDKQLAYLRSLGCPTRPATKLEASALIEKYRKM